MKEWLRTMGQTALLKTAAFERISVDPDAFLRGFLVIIAVALIAGIPRAAGDLAKDLQPGREDVTAPADVRGSLEAVKPWFERAGIPSAVIDQIIAQADANGVWSVTIGKQIADLPTRLPRALVHIARGLGGWLTTPFSAAPLPLTAAGLATWLGYGIWVMLFAKLLGGRADLPGFFGATALFVVPHILGIFAIVPVAGPILGVIAFVWGLAIYVKATAVSHSLSLERGLLAAILPFLLLLAALLVLLATLTAVLLLSATT